MSSSLAPVLAYGVNEDSISLDVRLTARVALIFFWLAYTGKVLNKFFGPIFAPLSRHTRELGLAFAAALTSHLIFVAWLFAIAQRPPLGESGILYFGVGACWVFAIAALSMCRLPCVRDAYAWRLFRIVGTEYVALLFFRDLVIGPIVNGVKHPIEYLPFSALITIGLALSWSRAVLRCTKWRLRRIDD